MTLVLELQNGMPDHRTRKVRSPNCPNDITDEPDVASEGQMGQCGTCAWGFFTLESALPKTGEHAENLRLVPARLKDGSHAGYKSQCGLVSLYFDDAGRLGALRNICGEARFFPAIAGNWAVERFLKRFPELRAFRGAS